MAVKNQVQLITYPDSLGGNLKALDSVLEKYFKDVFKGGIHILPPFPASGDRGFAPLTYLEIEPAFGTWEDIRKLGDKYDLLLDLMVNHISRQSEYFQDFIDKGRQSEYSDMFITLDKLWKNGEPNKEDIGKMFLRRIKPYSEFEIKCSGEIERVWTTFGKTDPSEQIDLDINSPKTMELLKMFFENFSRNKISIVRLDAVGYVIKKPGTSCFFVEPEIYEFLDSIKALADSLEIELLPEVHAHHSVQYKLAEHGFWIYDFILPYRILHALISGSGERLKEYLKSRPQKQFTMLDCHDGIPVKPDLDDLADTEEAQKVTDICVKRGALLSLIMSEEHKAADGFDVHQIRCSYYSALDCNDDAYIAARAIQFFTPGIPQVYYVGLLAGKNDMESVNRTGEGREINRHNYTIEEIKLASEEDTVKRLVRLIRFRNEYEAFKGVFSVLECSDDEIKLRWEFEDKYCCLHISLRTFEGRIDYIDNNRSKACLNI